MMISEFKAKAISMLKQVNASKTPLEITLRGVPVAQILPPEPVSQPLVKLDAGSGMIVDDLTQEEWEAETIEDDWADKL